MQTAVPKNINLISSRLLCVFVLTVVMHTTYFLQEDLQSGEQINRKALLSTVFDLAGGMCYKAGIRPGDKVAAYSENSVSYALLLLATWACGGVLVAINSMLTPGSYVLVQVICRCVCVCVCMYVRFINSLCVYMWCDRDMVANAAV